MKFNIKIILFITVCLFTQCFCEMGLFEAVAKDMDNNFMQNGIKNKPSLFHDSYKNKIKNERKLPFQNYDSIFENVGMNFNQVSEEIKHKNNNYNKISNSKASNQINSSLFSVLSDKNKEKNTLNENSIFIISNKKFNTKKSKIKINNHKSKSTSVVPGSPVHKNISGINNINTSNNKNSEIIQAQQNNNIISNEIKQLRYKTAILMELNSKLKSKIIKKKNLKRRKKKVRRNIVSFIQKNDERVTKIKTNIENKQISIKSKLSNKETQFNTIYQEANQNFSSLQAKLGDLSKLIEIIMNDEYSHLSTFKQNLNLNNMKVKEKLDVDQNVVVDGKVISKNIDLTSFRGDEKNLKFENPNTKLIIGNKIIHSSDLLKNLQLIQKFNYKCGDNLRQCKILTREDLIKRAMNQGKILEDLKGLRAQLEKLSVSSKLN